MARIIIALIVLIVDCWFIYFFQLPLDAFFVVLVFMSFKSDSMAWPIMGFIYFVLWDHLIHDFIPFYSLSGIIIFSSAVWLRINYPFFKKALSLLMVLVYTQFLWFMILFGYFISEGAGAPNARYIAPFILGNLIVSLGLAVIFYAVLSPGRGREFDRRLFT